jgi:hypothetical protein
MAHDRLLSTSRQRVAIYRNTGRRHRALLLACSLLFHRVKHVVLGEPEGARDA